MLFKRKRLSCLCWFLAGLSMLFLCSCDSGDGRVDNTGSISFNLEWKSGTAGESDHGLTANGDVCDDYQISTVNATIYDAANATVTAKSFTCSDHTGSFADVPAGSGYKLIIKGMVAGNPDWSGQATGLSVTDGQTTDAGLIAMTYQGSDTTAPNVTKVSPNASITDAALNTAINALFNEAMNGSTITASSFTLAKTSDNSSVAGQVSYDSISMTATFTPDANLEPNTKYVATLTTGIQDIAGNSLAGGNAADGSYQWTFITGTTTTVCTYAISPSAITLPSNSSSRTVSVIASDAACSWTASSSESWITITSGASGIGNGAVEYTVLENTAASERTGTVTIAGITLNIQQKAAGSTPITGMTWDTSNWDEVLWQ